MANPRTRMGRHVAARVAEEYGLDLFAAAVPRTARLAEMALRGKPAVIYDRRSAGSRAYFDLMDEIMARWNSRRAAARTAAIRAAAKPGNGGAHHGVGTNVFAIAAAAGLRLPGGLGLTSADDETGNDDEAGVEAVWDGLPAEGEPEMVSLDELIENEEESLLASGDDDWEDRRWGDDAERQERFH